MTEFFDKVDEKCKEIAAVDEQEMEIGLSAQIAMLRFLKSKMAEEKTVVTLRKKVLDALEEKVDDDEDIVSVGVLMKLLEILDKGENDKTSGILSVLRQNVLFQQVPNTSPGPPKEKLVDDKESITKDQLSMYRKLDNFLKKVESLPELDTDTTK